MQPEYFEWLVSKVTSPVVPADESARAVMGALYGIRVRSLPMIDDEPRLIDGKQLRLEYEDERGASAIALEDAANPDADLCTVLEMLVALSRRMDDIMRDPLDPSSSVPNWFWGMVSTMVGQSYYPCCYWSFPVNSATVHIVSDCALRFLGRQYDGSGHNGNIFVGLHPSVDIREMDIWTQACWFMSARRHIAPQPGTSVWYPQL